MRWRASWSYEYLEIKYPTWEAGHQWSNRYAMFSGSQKTCLYIITNMFHHVSLAPKSLTSWILSGIAKTCRFSPIGLEINTGYLHTRPSSSILRFCKDLWRFSVRFIILSPMIIRWQILPAMNDDRCRLNTPLMSKSAQYLLLGHQGCLAGVWVRAAKILSEVQSLAIYMWTLMWLDLAWKHLCKSLLPQFSLR